MTTRTRSTQAQRRAGLARLGGLTGIVLALTACGGGGGDAASGAPLVPSAATITAVNSEGVARQSLVATTYLGDAADVVTGAQVAPDAQTLFAFARSQIGRMPGWFARRTSLVSGVITTETADCSGGGSIALQQNDVNGNGKIDVGDSGTLTARNCVEQGAVISGVLTISFSAVSGDLDTDVFSATASVTLQDLRATTSAGSVAGSGQFTLALRSTSATDTGTTLNVASLSVSGSFGGTSDTVTMQNFFLGSTTALVGGRLRTTTTVSGTVGSNALAGGTVNLGVVPGEDLIQFQGDTYPSGGQLIATGAAGSRLRLTVQSATHVLLEVDADGDGRFESSSVKTWVSLV